MDTANNLVIGMDFGTDSVRAILIDPLKHGVRATSVAYYTRWKAGLYCDPQRDMYRQHPLDYVEAIDRVLEDLLREIPADVRKQIGAIGTTTTGSTPVAVDRKGAPLALTPAFRDNPNAMFILWKDHTAGEEAKAINHLAQEWPINFTKYSGGAYSSEWFWSKILHVHRTDPEIAHAAHSWVEQSDWIPMYLSGLTDVGSVKRNRCAAGHKALWHEAFGGFPPADFFQQLDPTLTKVVQHLRPETYTSDHAFGRVGASIRDRFGFAENMLITVGGIDAHHGAVGAGIQSNMLVKVVGTSTCDLLVAPSDSKVMTIDGICGQVNGSILPGMVGYEAGQSAFGDIFNWFKQFLFVPFADIARSFLTADQLDLFSQSFFEYVTQKASMLPVTETDLVFTDYFNGRRTPDVDHTLRANASGFDLSTTAVHQFKALVTAAAFGSKAIKDRFEARGIAINTIRATGGIPSKSPYVAQVLADVLEADIHVLEDSQTCALGAAIFAATVAGVYPNVQRAQLAMAAKIERTYFPNAKNFEAYRKLYLRYQEIR